MNIALVVVAALTVWFLVAISVGVVVGRVISAPRRSMSRAEPIHPAALLLDLAA